MKMSVDKVIIANHMFIIFMNLISYYFSEVMCTIWHDALHCVLSGMMRCMPGDVLDDTVSSKRLHDGDMFHSGI
jgi:hypothetical protein